MKIAGRKNDGAWFRTNAQIQGNTRLGTAPMGEDDRVALIAYLNASLLFADLYFNDILALQAEAGVGVPDGAPTTKEEFIAGLINNGIPRQVWNGKLTFTTYTRTGEVGARVYTPNYVDNARNFANELRGFLKRFLFARRQVRDVFNLGNADGGNPGGSPNAGPDGD